jgi:hypothetical protein
VGVGGAGVGSSSSVEESLSTTGPGTVTQGDNAGRSRAGDAGIAGK